ncbi:MAG: hypothetical protein KDB03_01360 [Planctomycetales bacterium]|nr:hypothetical protein [Planctomycetales bacterium]
MNKKQIHHWSGFSLIEFLVSTLIVFAVVGVASSWLVPQRSTAEAKSDINNIEKLNSLAHEYYLKTQMWPDDHLHRLFAAGLTNTREIETPFGDHYRWDQRSRSVYNPVRKP